MSINPGTTTNPDGISTTVVPLSIGKSRPTLRNPIAIDQDVEHPIAAVRRIDDPPAFQ
jgi:hypothetical protein